jgi:hypothetical protein
MSAGEGNADTQRLPHALAPAIAHLCRSPWLSNNVWRRSFAMQGLWLMKQWPILVTPLVVSSSPFALYDNMDHIIHYNLSAAVHLPCSLYTVHKGFAGRLMSLSRPVELNPALIQVLQGDSRLRQGLLTRHLSHFVITSSPTGSVFCLGFSSLNSPPFALWFSVLFRV